MIRILALTIAVAGLAPLVACNTGDGPEGNPWYSRGDANYDTIRRATDACKAKGGTFQLKPGGDSSHLADWECVMPAQGSH